MLIFSDQKLAYLAVPKTGSTGIEAALAPYASIAFRSPPVIKHIPAYRFRRFVHPMLSAMTLNDIEIIAVIREPVSWLGSWYRFRGRAELDGMSESSAKMSFDAFVLAYLLPERPPVADVGSQLKFLTNGARQPLVHRLFKYEDSENLVEFMSDRLGFQFDLQRRNASPPRDFQLSATVESRLQSELSHEFQLHARADGTLMKLPDNYTKLS
jgi:hypothetical protein